MIKKNILFTLIFNITLHSDIFKLKNAPLDSNNQKIISDCWKELGNTEKIIFDEPSKQIIIFSKNIENLSIFEKILKKIDIKRKSIHINIITGRIRNQTQSIATLLPGITSLENVYRYGINWFGIYNRNNKTSNFTFQGIGGDLTDFPTSSVPIDPYDFGNLYVNPNQFNFSLINDTYTDFASFNPPGVFLPFTFGSNMATSRLSNILFLQDSNVYVETAKSAEITTIENQAALYAGQNSYPIYTLTNNLDERNQLYQTWRIQYKPYGILIKIKPRIADDNIILKIYFERINLDNTPTPVDQGTGIIVLPPIFGVYRIKETITLKRDEALLISSALTSNKINSFGKIPILCKIPIIGKLFSSEVINTFNDDEFVIITPTIIE